LDRPDAACSAFGPEFTPELARSAARAAAVPRPFYGWVMLAISMVALLCTSPGQTFCTALFNPSLREALNISHSQLAGAYMLATLLAGLPLTAVGALTDRLGPRLATGAVAVLLGFVCISTSQVTGLVSLFFAFLALRFLGQGCLSLLSGYSLAMWFDRRLGLADGVRHLAMAGAIAVLPGIVLWLISNYGWRWSYAILGLSVWIVMLPLVLFFFRNRPEDMGQLRDGGVHTPESLRGEDNEGLCDLTLGQAFRTRAYWIVMAGNACWSLIATAIMFNIIPILKMKGLTQADAARTFTTFAVSLGAMHLVGGFLADRLPLNRLLCVSVGGLGVSVLVLLRADSPAGVHSYAVLMGLSQGLLTAVTGPLWARYYGRSHLGKIRGSLGTALVAASSLGPFIVGGARDYLGGYQEVLLLLAIIPLPLSFAALLATPPGRERRSEIPVPGLTVNQSPQAASDPLTGA
jgi:sugar phosphate permease